MRIMGNLINDRFLSVCGVNNEEAGLQASRLLSNNRAWANLVLQRNRHQLLLTVIVGLISGHRQPAF